MTKRDREALKSVFELDDIPQQQDYEDVFDSALIDEWNRETLVLGASYPVADPPVVSAGENDKIAKLRCVPRDDANPPVVLIGALFFAGENQIYIGGGLSGVADAPATKLRVFLDNDPDTASGGREVMRVDAIDNVGYTSLSINYNGTLKRMNVGAVDSGGTGSRLLTITN